MTTQLEPGCTYDNPTTPVPRVTTADGRVIELRYSTSSKCAWGRITDGAPGDEIWVDRSRDGGQSWEQLGYTRIEFGADKFTEAFNDDGVVMRAGGRKSGGEVRVTEWY